MRKELNLALYSRFPLTWIMEAAASFARSRAGREALITVLSKAKEGIEGKTGTVICQ